MKKVLLMMFVFFCMSVSFGAEIDDENYIVVELYDGRLELRAIEMYIANQKTTVFESEKRSLIDAAIDAAKETDEVKLAARIQPVYLSETPTDVNVHDSWRFDYTKVTESWDQINDGLGDVIVAVIDSGIDLSHPDLNVIDGYDFADDDAEANDVSGHGTHVAGIIGAKKNSGLDKVVGICPNVQLMPVKIFSDSGLGNTANLALGIRYAVDHDADVINLSVNFLSPDEVVASAIQYAYAKGVVLVGSASNDSNNWINNEQFDEDTFSNDTRFFSNVKYPAAYQEVISVGSVNYDGPSKTLAISDFSNIADLDSNIQLDVVAPGSDIYSSNIDNENLSISKSGTSMSTAHVSGLAALLKAKYVDLSGDAIRDVILSTTYDPNIEIPPAYDRKATLGKGLINVFDAINYTGLKYFQVKEIPDLFEFLPTVFAYSGHVDYDVSEITLDFETISDTVVSTSPGAFSLLQGENTINIESSKYNYSSDYNFNIFRDRPMLSDIQFTTGENTLNPLFDINRQTNTISFSPDIKEVTIEPVLKSDKTYMTIDGARVDSKKIPLETAIKAVKIEVFPSSGHTEFTTVYYLYLKRSESPSLASITIDAVLLETFESDQYEYVIEDFSYSKNEIDLLVVKASDASTVTYKLNDSDYVTSQSDISGLLSKIDLLASADNILYIKVVNELKQFKEYTLIFKRNYVNLLDLALDFENDDPIDLGLDGAFTFDPYVKNYSLAVPFAASNVEMTVKRAHQASSVTIKVNDSAYTVYEHDPVHFEKALGVGFNKIMIKVEYGAGQSYQVNTYDMDVFRGDGLDLKSVDITYTDLNNKVVPGDSSYHFNNDLLIYHQDVPNVGAKVNLTIVRANDFSDALKSKVYTKINDDAFKAYQIDQVMITEDLRTGSNELLIKVVASTVGHGDDQTKIFKYVINRKKVADKPTPGVTLPPSVNKVVEPVVEAVSESKSDLASGLKPVVLEDGSKEVHLTLESVEELIQLNKDVEINFGDAVLVLNSKILKALNLKADLKINYKALEVTPRETLVQAFKLELKADKESILTTPLPIPLMVNYPTSRINNKNNIAVYALNEKTGKWLYVGGKIVGNGKIRFEARDFGHYAILENFKTFKDIEDHWAKEAIEVLASRSITSGISESEFAPERKITNAEFIVLLNKVLALPESNTPIVYKNVAPDSWYTPYIKNAYGAGIITSTYGVMMKPEDYIKREEMAEILMGSYMYYSGLDKEKLHLDGPAVSNDEGLVSNRYKGSVRTAYHLGLIVGDDVNNFNPKFHAKRAEAAIVIKKLLVLLNLL